MADITLIFEEQPISLELTTATPINLVLDGGATYTAGTGISIAGAVISNTAPNVVQELSISGQDLTLSGGGGTVAIPSGGNGIYGGSGAVPDGTVATVGAGSLTFSNNDIKLSSSNGTVTSNIDINDDGFLLKSVSGASTIEFFSDGVSGTFNAQRGPLNFNASKSTGAIVFSGTAGTLEISNPGDKIYFSSNTGLGVEYLSDYSATIVTNPTSFTDVTSVNLLKQTPVSYTSAAAPNNCIFYSTTLSKLAYKDPGGTVNPLY